jgi:putative membrane protein
MLLVLCVDLDDDLGRKTRFDTPVVGRDAVEEAAVALATADPEDSDVNVLFEGVHLYDGLDEEEREVAVVTGTNGGDVAANRKVGEEVDTVLARLTTGEDVRAVVVTDGAQDESVIPVIRSRVPIDGVRRVVVRQAQDLESMYYTIKQVLDDPETRGTILIPMGILLLVYPLFVVAEYFQLPAETFGVLSGLLGLYLLFRGLGAERAVDRVVEAARAGLYAGRVTLVTYVVAAALLVIGGAGGVEQFEALQAANGDVGVLTAVAALANGAVLWFAAAGIVASLGRITDEYLNERFRWRYCNAPFYVVAIASVLEGVSAYFLAEQGASYLAGALTVGTLLGVVSTLVFAVAEARLSRVSEATV